MAGFIFILHKQIQRNFDPSFDLSPPNCRHILWTAPYSDSLSFLVFSLNSNMESHAHKFPIYFSNRMLYSLMSIGLLTFMFVHCEFLEYWNAQKSIWRIWECFSHLLDKRIPKIWKKLNPHDGFLSYLQNSTANSAHLAAHFCPALVCPQTATVRIQFLPYFWNPLIK